MNGLLKQEQGWNHEKALVPFLGTDAFFIAGFSLPSITHSFEEFVARFIKKECFKCRRFTLRFRTRVLKRLSPALQLRTLPARSAQD
ncbi:hypothetical protein E4665_05750 [Sporolactobacillus shoreae]|uniref:Uncharacterized protein n=1 Tax=Sporolactobacillus shoreae TaxID=1465501 RepID=A0A4Z0GR67_9BACL|nr:hypothetical protein E4665_05750 [Sporolactobacillus shoreae]